MQIPPEIDELMWAIAENDTVDAVYDFEHRFPKYQQELMRRIKTVSALKAQGKTVPSREIPVFQARPIALDRKPIQWLGYAAVSLAVISTAVLAATRNKPTPAVKPVDVNTQSRKAIPELPIATPSVPIGQATPPIDPAKNPPPKPTNQFKKSDLILEVTKLHSAIQLIAASGEVTVTIAPGLENPDVQVSFTQMTAMEMLTALGKDYAFTPVVDGEKHILILPVKDDSNPQDGNEELN